MRPLPSFHLVHPAVKAARVAVAAGTIAALVVLGACSDTASKTLSTTATPRGSSTSSGGFTNATRVTLCVNGPAGNYQFTNTGFIKGDPVASVTTINQPVGTPYLVASGGNPLTLAGCQTVIQRTVPKPSPGDPNYSDPWSNVTITSTGPVGGTAYASTDCINDDGVVPAQPHPCGTTSNPTTAFANFEHGTVVTFNFASTGEVIPMFVIGDLVPWTISAAPIRGAKPKGNNTVNFWGSQWWKNNPMSDFHSNGWPSFKGYASSVDLTPGPGAPCGTWISRVGNSPPPPKTIPDLVGIIVTNNVVKIGPDEGGAIQRIIVVRSDGGYGPNPGHDGNGPVVSIQCGA